MLCETKSDLLQVGFVEFCQVHIVYSYEKQISKRQSHGLPLVASCRYSRCYNLHLKKGKKKERRLCSSLFDWKYRSSLSSAWFRVLLTGSSVHFHVIQQRNDLPVFMVHSANPRGGILYPPPSPNISHVHTPAHYKQRPAGQQSWSQSFSLPINQTTVLTLAEVLCTCS